MNPRRRGRGDRNRPHMRSLEALTILARDTGTLDKVTVGGTVVFPVPNE